MASNWRSRMLDLAKQINQVDTNYTPFLVLQLLADCAVQYVEWWTSHFDEELELKSRQAGAVGLRLVRVLDTALEVYNNNTKSDKTQIHGEFLMPSKGEFMECIDDLRIYTQMMNRLLGRLVPSHNKNKTLLLHLQHKVELDSSLLHKIIENAFESTSLAMFQREDLQLSDVSPFNCEAIWDSSHITRVIGHSKVEDKHGVNFLVLEHMDGNMHSLWGRIQYLAEAIDVTIQIAKGMHHLHCHQLYGVLDESSVFFKTRANGTYLLKIDPFMGNPVAHPGDRDRDAFRFAILLDKLLNLPFMREEAPASLHRLLDYLEGHDPRHIRFKNICEQLWLVMEDILTG